MKRILLMFFLFLSGICSSQSFSFDSIPYSEPDIIAPGRGAEQWHNSSDRIPNPTSSQNINVENSLDVYYRFPWANLEGATEGSYNWAYFDTLVATAIKNGQKFSFGIMTVNPDAEYNPNTYDGGKSCYPLYLHNQMQALPSNQRDFLSNGVWIPNYNSSVYLGRLRALHEALNDHIKNTSYYVWVPGNPRYGKTINFRDVIYCIDIRGYGSWGEWNTGSSVTWGAYPTGRQPTIETLKEIIDLHTEVFEDWPLVMMIAAYNAYPGGTSIDLFHPYAEVAHYALNARNKWGQVGFRRDQVGSRDSYLSQLLENNTAKYPAGVGETVGQKFLNLWKSAPGTGEPMPSEATQPDGMIYLMNQIELYHHTSFGNGNWIGRNGVSETVRDRIRAGFKRAGYRLKLTGGSASATGSSLTIQLGWSNIGVAPTYEKWNVIYELRSGSSVVWRDTSYFRPFLFLPGDSMAIDVFDRIGMPQGTYNLYVIIKDSAEYRDPLPLAIEGRQSDGSYLLLSNIVIPEATGGEPDPDPDPDPETQQPQPLLKMPRNRRFIFQ